MHKLIALAVLFASSAVAHDAVLTWEHPTEYDDGQPLPVTDIRETRVEYGRCVEQAFPAQPEGTLVVPGPAASVGIVGLTNGWWCFRAFTVSTEGVESDPSGTAVAHYVGKPKPPSNLVAAQ